MSFSANRKPLVRGGYRMKAPKRPTHSIESSLAQLKEAIGHIHAHDASKLSFEECYRHAYNAVLYKHGQKLYDELAQVISDHLDKVCELELLPYITDESFSQRLISVWGDHVVCMGKLRDIYSYMDKVFTPQKDLLATWDLGRLLFARRVLLRPATRPLLDVTINTLLDVIRSDRSGLHVNRGQLRRVLEILYELDDESTSPSKAFSAPHSLRPSLYHMRFQPRFLDVSRAFYQAESASLISSADTPHYLRHVQTRISEEHQRLHSFLFEDTSAGLISVLNTALITEHALEIVDNPNVGLKALLDESRIADLSLLHTLFSRVPEGLPLLRDKVGSWVERVGEGINDSTTANSHVTEELQPSRVVKQEPGEDVSLSDEKTKLLVEKEAPQVAKKPTNPSEIKLRSAINWVENVLSLKDKTDDFFVHAFSSEKPFEKKLNDAFTSFVNKNSHAPEYLSLYMDEHLKRGLKGKSDVEVENILEKSVSAFRFLVEKDAFERYYNQHLSRRLLFGRSVSDDAEKSILSKFKVEAGAAFTKAAEGMLRDIKLSEEMHTRFRKASPGGLDVSPTICTQNCWPFSSKDTLGRLPVTLAKPAEDFSRFYTHLHTGRKLRWRPDMGSVDVRARFKSRTHELTVSTYAFGVLELFDVGVASLTYQDILNATAMPEGDLRRTLQSLACAKYRVLRKEPKGREVNTTDVFSFNDAFVCPQVKIRIQTVANRVETPAERKETEEKLLEMRHTLCDACIVRIMKNRKVLAHAELVNETIEQLSTRFLPTPAMVKQAIERLIDKDYLERSDGDRRILSYVA